MAEQNHEYEKVIDYIRNQIEAENLTINSKLPTERAIAEELSISRNSTREALRILEHMGILKSIHGSGNYLTDNISMQMSEMLRYMILLKSISKLDICHFRRDMEKTVCRVVMKSEISEDELDKISDILNSESDEYDEVERDRLFHYSLIYATNNKLWICFMEAIMDIYREWIDAVLSNADSDTKKLLKEVHNSIFSSIKERDMAKCEASIDKHYDIIERELFMRWFTMKYKVYIFDMDGTILNTLEDLANALNYSLGTNNYPKRTIDEVRWLVGNGIYKLVERGVPTGTEKADIDRVFKTFKEYYSVHCEDKTKPYENIIEIIKKLRAENCHIAVVSNKADYAVQKLCERYFPNLIDIAVGERENVRKKPAPDSVLEVLKKLNADKSTAVYIGDSEVDIQTAKNADMDSIIVTWGFREKAYLLENGAKLTIDEPIDILNI